MYNVWLNSYQFTGFPCSEGKTRIIYFEIFFFFLFKQIRLLTLIILKLFVDSNSDIIFSSFNFENDIITGFFLWCVLWFMRYRTIRVNTSLCSEIIFLTIESIKTRVEFIHCCIVMDPKRGKISIFLSNIFYIH